MLNKRCIVYHCMHCHRQYESMLVATMNDFEENYTIVYELDPTYFRLRISKLAGYWSRDDLTVYRKIIAFNNTITKAA